MVNCNPHQRVTYQAVEEELIERDIALQLLKDNLIKAQDRMKKLADKGRTEKAVFLTDFSEGKKP